MNIVCQNRKAYHDYHIEEKTEAGIALLGTEVKSLREGKGNLKDSYVLAKDSELFLINCHISPYSHGNITNHEPLRTRKLLLHKKEIEIKGAGGAKKLLAYPFKDIFPKALLQRLRLGLQRARGSMKKGCYQEKEADREIERAMKSR